MRNLRKCLLPLALLTFVGVMTASAGWVIYEPFNMATGTLNNVQGGEGLGEWQRVAGSDANEWVSSSPGLTYGTLPTAGNRAALSASGGQRRNRVSTGSSLDTLLTDGATLWMSVVANVLTSANAINFLTLSSDDTDYWGAALNSGNSIGIGMVNGSDYEYQYCVSGVNTRVAARVDLHNLGGVGAGFRPHLLVAKFTWGEGGADDTFELYLPDSNLNLGSVQGTAQTLQIDQSTFNRLVVTATGGLIEWDEIRFGATYQDVISDPAPGTLVYGE